MIKKKNTTISHINHLLSNQESHRQNTNTTNHRKQNIHGRAKLKTQSTCRNTNNFVADGISTNVTITNAEGFIICVIMWTVMNLISGSPIRLEDGDHESAELDSFTKNWLAKELTSKDLGMRKYKRGYKWDWSRASGYSNAIDSSLTAEPLDPPPQLEEDPCAKYALLQYKKLFSIECPIDVDIFEFLLSDHPNQEFVKYVILGLKQGFWPMSDIPSNKTVIVQNHKVCNECPEILEKARDEEIKAGRYSEGFYTLLQGMKVSPLLLVGKKGTSKKRVCTDMSYGSPSINDSIKKEKIKVSFNSLISFAPYIVEMRKRGIKLVVWKSDVQNAYRILAMALQWQMRQIVRIGDLFHVDKCANFGSAASPKLWCSFFSLVLWIARTRLGLTRINNLMDDTWGVCPASSIVIFKGHECPLDQSKLLLLFDLLKIPWEWKKTVIRRGIRSHWSHSESERDDFHVTHR